MDEVRQQFVTINKRIFNHRDGEVFRMQKEYGAKYKKSLGVSMFSLENIAKEFGESHEVARLLWEFGGREQTLVAAMIEEAEKVEIRELEVYLLQTNTPELWEQISRKLLRRLAQIERVVYDWLERKEEVLHVYSIFVLGYFPNLLTEELLQKIVQLNVEKDSYLEKCTERILLKNGVRNEQYFQLLQQNAKMQSDFPSLLEEIAAFYE